MDENFEEVLQETYEKTLKLAVSIAENKANLMKTPVNGTDLKFVKKIAKDYKDFQDLHEKGPKRPKEPLYQTLNPLLSPLKSKKTLYLPKNSGKLKLNSSLEQRNRYISDSKAGKLIKYAEIGPNILEKIKTNSSIYTDDTTKQTIPERNSTLPHVSVLTGKLKPALELPSFKEYVKSERSKDPKDLAFEKINHCNKILLNFEKEMSGLEIFINSNPGAIWNNDKKLLLKLNAYPNHRALIIKAYNDQFESPFVRKRTRKMTIKDDHFEKHEEKHEKFLSQTPNPKNVKEFYSKKKKQEDPGSIVKRCYSRFRRARENQNKKLINILESLNLTRFVNLKQKAVHILNDNEKFKDKLYSIKKMDEIKKKIDFEQRIRLKKSKRQAVIYDRLMEFLKKKPDGPSDVEINFVEILKEILEEG